MSAPKSALDAATDAIAKELIDRGELIAAGFHGYRTYVMPPGAPAIQVNECRMAFFAGAQHVFATMLRMMDPGDDPTENDMRRMGQIQDELEKFARDLELRVTPAAGNG